MQGAKKFEALVKAGNPVGEIIGIDSFMVQVRGLQPANVHAVVRFQDDTRGYIHEVFEDHVVVMKLLQRKQANLRNASATELTLKHMTVSYQAAQPTGLH